MAKTKIILNSKEYLIDESVLSSASNELQEHLSTVMSGSGAVINLDGVPYNIDATKLAAAKDDFVAHLGTIAGNGSKIIVGGVEYFVDSTKINDTINDMQAILDKLTTVIHKFTFMQAREDGNQLYAYVGVSTLEEVHEVIKPALETNMGMSWDEIVSLYDDEETLWKLLEAEFGIPMTESTFVPQAPQWAFTGIKEVASIDEVQIKSEIEDIPVTSIGASAFYGCSSLTNVIIPNSITRIGDGAFDECVGLTSITIPDSVTEISEVAFRGCTSLTSVTIPNSVTSIGNSAFENCTSLTSVTILSGVTSIPERAFYGCSSLTSITFNGAMAQWNTIAKGEYWNRLVPATYIQCSDGKVWLIDPPVEEERLEGDGAEYYTLAPTALSFRSTAPLNELQEVQINGVTVDPSNYTLEEGSTIVTFPIDYLKTLNVGSYEVAVASDSKTVKGGFTVAAPELNEHGFYYNQPYTAYVAMSGIVTSLLVCEDGTFAITAVGRIPEMGTYELSGNTIVSNSSMGELHSTISADGKEIYCVEIDTTFILSDEFVMSDADYIYSYVNELDGCEITSIDRNKSVYSDIKTGVNGYDTVKVADYAFYNNTNLTTIPEIPSSVTAIGLCAFFGCTALQSIIIPANINHIGIDAFSNCTNLSNVTFEGTVEQWNAITFVGDWNINIPATHVQCSDGQVSMDGTIIGGDSTLILDESTLDEATLA